MQPTGSQSKTVGVGLIGGGRFGQFACQQYRQLSEVRLVAVADRDASTCAQAADALQIDAAESVQAMLERDDVQLVYIAAPPATHHKLVTQALEAGKHVLCEKPLALNLMDARVMVDLAHQRKRLLSVNLIMRYNPLCQVVQRIITEQLLGKPLHGFFENYAKDEPLPPEHWFWDRSQSGGIFIEHGVHFFDLFRWWLGDGKVVAAQQITRPGAQLIEQVQCTAQYPQGVLVNFYHGFTQAERMDRQEMRLLFERGTVRLFEWVPTSLEIDCIADHATINKLEAMLPHCHANPLAMYAGSQRQVTSRHKQYEVDGRYLIRAEVGMSKPELYGHILCSLMTDQIHAIINPSHQRQITEEQGYTSLATAVEAQTLADNG